MSLDWDMTKCKDTETLKSEENWPTTQAIIFLCMAVGMGKIKDDKDAKEWYLRAKFYENLKGRVFTDEESITLDLVRKYIGLDTNVTFERRPGWCKRISELFFKDEGWNIKDE